MSLADHLTELRSRLMRATIAVLVLGVASLVFSREIFGLLMRPVLEALPADNKALIYTSGIEEINVLMKVGLYSGIAAATPVILWQIWSFVAPGLYPSERRYASPFVVLGTLAFVAGASFCYFVVLPSMFKFLLREGDSAALEQRLDTAKLREAEALRFLRLGELDQAGQLAKETAAELGKEGDGRSIAAGDLGTTLLPSEGLTVTAQLEGLGRLVDASHEAYGASARPVLRQVMELRVQAVNALGRGDYADATKRIDDAAGVLAGVAPTQTAQLAELWKLEKAMGLGRARYAAQNWTRPMLTMREQLSLVLIMLLAFGVIFELPLVIAVLGAAGIVRAQFLFKYQRHAFVVCLILAAVITPSGDAVNLAMMAGPMIACYELGVLSVWLIERRRAHAAASTTLARHDGES